MTHTLKQPDELEKKATQTEERLNSLGRADGDYHTKEHDDAADDAWIARRNFERALIDFWRSEEGRQMRENSEALHNIEQYRINVLATEDEKGNPAWFVVYGANRKHESASTDIHQAISSCIVAIRAARGEDK